MFVSTLTITVRLLVSPKHQYIIMMIKIPQVQELIKANIQRSKVIQDQVIIFNINIIAIVI